MPVSLDRGMSEPAKKASEDQIELIWFERPQLSNRLTFGMSLRYGPGMRQLQEWDINVNLVLGIAKAGGMREDGDQGAVYVAVAHTDHEGWANLLRHAEIKKPHFTGPWRHFPQLQGRQRAGRLPRPFPHRPMDRIRTVPPGAGTPL
jgi:hypothetical protein